MAEKASRVVAGHGRRVFHSAAAGPSQAGGERRCGKLVFRAGGSMLARHDERVRVRACDTLKQARLKREVARKSVVR